tara:strand:- start:1556 stop:2749 length:1194 start_codon:yes stop_codon:yes gene_type:complete
MNQLSTTSVANIKRSAKKITLISAAIILAATLSFQATDVTKADDYDRRIAEIEREIEGYQDEAQKLNDKAQSLQKELNALSTQKKIIQKQIDLKEAERKQLIDKIAKNEQKIVDNQDLLGETIATLYLSGDVTPLEMLASSRSISEYVDKEAYQSSIRDNLVLGIATIKRTKAELEKQKQNVEQVIAEQKFARDALVAKENERVNLISQTRGQETAYQQLVGKREQQKLKLQQEQQAAIEAALRASGGLVDVLPGDPNKGGYPWEKGCWVDAYAWSHGGTNGDGTDPLGYGCRQCVSYTAWRVGDRTGNFPYYWGNANQWPASARAAGYSTGSTPKVNSVGVISAGQYGHVVWVEAVNGDGTIDISQYNYFNAGGSGWGHYSKMRVNASTYDTYIYF